jgi:hypothetical protein
MSGTGKNMSGNGLPSQAKVSIGAAKESGRVGCVGLDKITLCNLLQPIPSPNLSAELLLPFYSDKFRKIPDMPDMELLRGQF